MRVRTSLTLSLHFSHATDGDMETLLPTQVSSLDGVEEHFLYHHQHSPVSHDSSASSTADLPLLSYLHADLDQLLSEESSRPVVPDMESRMSPDSSVEWAVQTQQQQQPHHHHIHHPQLPSPASSMVSSPMSSTSSSAPPQPDSTTSEPHYDSDAFNSEDSCDSTNENTFLGPLPLPHQQQPMMPLQQQQQQVKKKKKSKRAGAEWLRCGVSGCGYSTRYKEHLTSHMHTHETNRNYMCSDCGQTFKWSHSLKRHQRTHQAADQYKYCCRHCCKPFSRKDHLTIHENLHTASSENYPCADCGATFKNKKTLAGHAKTHSTSRKGFHCEQCDSEFTRRASLNRHVRAAHAGQTIGCPFCPATFSYKNTMEDHKKAVHNDGRREFGCDLCGVQFAVKAYLTKHMVSTDY